MFSLQCSSVSLWAIYGILLRDVPIIAANTLVFIEAITILMFKRKYKSNLPSAGGNHPENQTT
jgi:MtN3 and saliva related transmembrane protein